MHIRTGICRRLWLFMLEHGGRWSPDELAEVVGRGRYEVYEVVRDMCRSGSVSRFRGGLRKNSVEFGVTLSNRIPMELTLRDIADAVGIRAVIETVPAGVRGGGARKKKKNGPDT